MFGPSEVSQIISVTSPRGTETAVRLLKKRGLSFRKSVLVTEQSFFENHLCALMPACIHTVRIHIYIGTGSALM